VGECSRLSKLRTHHQSCEIGSESNHDRIGRRTAVDVICSTAGVSYSNSFRVSNRGIS
jgi:hypothetical protein